MAVSSAKPPLLSSAKVVMPPSLKLGKWLAKLLKSAPEVIPPRSTVKPSAPTDTAAMFRLSRSLRLIARRLVRELLSLASTVMLSSSAKRRPFTSNACAVPSPILTTPATLAASTSMVETVSDPN